MLSIFHRERCITTSVAFTTELPNTLRDNHCRSYLYSGINPVFHAELSTPKQTTTTVACGNQYSKNLSDQESAWVVSVVLNNLNSKFQRLSLLMSVSVRSSAVIIQLFGVLCHGC